MKNKIRTLSNKESNNVVDIDYLTVKSVLLYSHRS